MSFPYGSVDAPLDLKRKLAAVMPGSLGLVGIAVCTWLAFRVGQSFAFTGFLHLVVVVLTARYGGFRQAPVAAGASLNYFFVPPIFSFGNPRN